jgi:hypothetical protein
MHPSCAQCPLIWINEQTGHRILCGCKKCNHGKIELNTDESGDLEFAPLSHQTHQQHRDAKLVSQQDPGVLRD